MQVAVVVVQIVVIFRDWVMLLVVQTAAVEVTEV
jgi:hypothetical protein